MDPGDQNVSLETFNSWKVEALKDFLGKRGLSTNGTKAELAALCFAATSMNVPVKESESEYMCKLKNEYKNLLCVDGKNIPDPLQIGCDWQDEKEGMPHWPPLFLSDIVKFLVERGNTGDMITKYMNDYKIGKAFEYVEANFIKEIFYHPISTTSPLCFLRAKCTPSQRLNQEHHTLWIAVCKETGAVKSAFCSCTAGMGQTCNHVAALMFRVEMANKLGVTSCTSAPCSWKVPAATCVLPVKIIETVVKKSRHGQVKSRSLVSTQKTEYRPQASMNIDRDSLINDLRKALPNACVFKGIDLPEEVASTEKNGTKVASTSSDKCRNVLQQNTCTTDIENLIMINIAENEGIRTSKDFIERQPILTPETVMAIQEKTVGQSNNSMWHQLRRGRITASNFYPIFTRVNSYNKNADIDMSSSISTVMGLATPSPNIRALKFGREMEPVAKEMYREEYRKKHVNACFEECGLFLDQNKSFLAASPDMLVACDCCGEGLLEVKCTLKPKCEVCLQFCTCNLPDYLGYVDGRLEIKKSHKYFCQVQGQLAVTQRQWCDFFVYSCNGTFLERVLYEESYYKEVHENLIFFFKSFIAPKILEGPSLESSTLVNDQISEDISSPTMEVEVQQSGSVCFCVICKNQVFEKENIKSFGQRSICCDLCDTWFHFSCVGIKKSSLKNMDTWLCSRCSTCN
ncbi:uncharacterized protein LOC111125467 [Crassostrea virginica]|uniref:Uncharacterized protein LOC111125467 n=1 Tax=Crassostrea virginica TaxID=6565 RepID=A0A8B8DAF6_CRAVI|nr:uncharacterized protein LOC111125467 [Crassostrea virginica]